LQQQVHGVRPHAHQVALGRGAYQVDLADLVVHNIADDAIAELREVAPLAVHYHLHARQIADALQLNDLRGQNRNRLLDDSGPNAGARRTFGLPDPARGLGHYVHDVRLHLSQRGLVIGKALRDTELSSEGAQPLLVELHGGDQFHLGDLRINLRVIVRARAAPEDQRSILPHQSHLPSVIQAREVNLPTAREFAA
jgi:hypothetical protein